MKEAKRRLRNLMLDRLQFRYTAVLVVLTAALLGGLGTLIYRYSREATEAARLTIVATIEDAQAQSAILSALDQGDASRLWLLIGAGVLLLLTLTAFGIVVTHKVAGPLHRMSSLLDRVREGKLGAPVGHLRKGDELQRFFALFAAMFDSLRLQAESDRDKLAEAISALEKLDLPAGAQAPLGALRDLQRDKERRLANDRPSN